MSYVYGLLKNGQTVIGSAHLTKIDNPALVEVATVPYINPITNQPDPTKLSVGIRCLALPVSWIFLQAIDTILSYPNESEQLVKAYKESVLHISK